MEVPSAASKIERTKSTNEEEESLTVRLPLSCSNCQQAAELVVQKTTIPHFHEIILMCMVCDHCGFKTTEIKNSGSMPLPTYGTRFTLSVIGVEDLHRDVVISDSAAISIPDLELEQEEGGFDGLYTTVEGILKKVLARLENASPLAACSAVSDDPPINNEVQKRYAVFLRKLRCLGEGQYFPFRFVINDPLGASFIGSRADTRKWDADSGLVVERMERSHEQNERLGLHQAVNTNAKLSLADNA